MVVIDNTVLLCSGGAGSAAKVVQTSTASPFGNQTRTDQHFTSPFSTFGAGTSAGAISPFSQAPCDTSAALQPPQVRGSPMEAHGPNCP